MINNDPLATIFIYLIGIIALGFFLYQIIYNAVYSALKKTSTFIDKIDDQKIDFSKLDKDELQQINVLLDKAKFK